VQKIASTHSNINNNSNTSETTTTTMASLPWNDVNLLIVTDVHSWIAGHARHGQEHLDANYGHVLSFYQRLKRRHHDRLFFVMNGDFMDGTGLSTIPPQHLTPLLQQMPWDALNVGNHELYFDDTVRYLQDSGFIQHWNGTYLSSNTLLNSTRQPLTGHRHTFLHGTSMDSTPTTILTFGFLYNFKGNCASTIVEQVEEVVQQSWFVEILSSPPETYESIVVLAHMDCVDPLVTVILRAIRRHVQDPTLPVLFVTGHSHRRAFARLDDHAASLEAGRFLDTIGWMSFSLPRQHNESTVFDYRYLDANQQTLYETLGVSSTKDFATPQGRALTRQIHDTQRQLGLHQVLGCTSRTYSLEEGWFPYATGAKQQSSLWWLYLNEIVPQQLLDKVNDTTSSALPVFVQGTGAFRYSLLNGTITRDDVIAVCPFNDSIYEFDYELEGYQLLQVLDSLETSYGATAKYSMPAFGTSPMTIVAENRYRLYLPDFEYKRLSPFIDNVTTTPERPRAGPKKVCLDDDDDNGEETCLYTTDLWMHHVREQMPCLSNSGRGHDRERFHPDVLLRNGAVASMLNAAPPSTPQGDRTCLIAFAASFVLAVVVSFHLTASLMRKKCRAQDRASMKQPREDSVLEDIEELLEDATALLEIQNARRDGYGSMQSTIGHSSIINFSKRDFDKDASSLVRALSDAQNVVSGTFHGFRLCHWELRQSNDALYLSHPVVEVSTPINLLRSTAGEDKELAFEDHSIVADHSYAATCLPSRDINKCIDTQWAFSIVYSETYCVPVLYFHVQFCSGEPCSRHRVLEILHHQQEENASNIPEDTWEFVSQEQHPFTNMPFFFLHPCQTSQRLRLLKISDGSAKKMNTLWTWMSMILPALGYPIPPPAFLDIQSRMMETVQQTGDDN
jgi:2',3'-cyclic-nucleotide 2'-phosphodiesterase (5'-nucleotidase family)